MERKYTSQYEKNIKNLQGTFAVEGMRISEYSHRNLERIANGKASYQSIIAELHQKYARKDV